MTKSDTFRFHFRDVTAALGLLTRLPVAVDGTWATARGAASAWAYPVVGLILGVIAGVIATVCLWIGLPVTITAGLVLVATVMMTGAMHEDGLADCADGFWGGWDRARRLEIMKDSRIGTYGVAALVLGLGLRWLALSAALGTGLWAAVLVPAIVSRAAMVWVMNALPHARDGGLSRSVGRPGIVVAQVAVAVAAVMALVLLGAGVLPVAGVAALVTWGMMRVATAKIGGQTGDVLGAVQQVVEIAVLLVLAAG